MAKYSDIMGHEISWKILFIENRSLGGVCNMTHSAVEFKSTGGLRKPKLYNWFINKYKILYKHNIINKPLSDQLECWTSFEKFRLLQINWTVLLMGVIIANKGLIGFFRIDRNFQPAKNHRFRDWVRFWFWTSGKRLITWIQSTLVICYH